MAKLSPDEAAKRDAEIRKRDEEDRRAQQDAWRQGMLARAGMPDRLCGHLAAALATTKSHPWAKVLAKFEKRRGDGLLASVLGDYGTGKSQLGVALIHGAIEAGLSAKFVYGYEILDAVMDLFRGKKGKVDAVLAPLLEPQTLVIDEVNRGASEHDIRYLQRVVCKRFDKQRDTLLLSNERVGDFKELVGPRIVSRMHECGGIVEADWPSFRGPKKGAHHA